MEMKTSSLFITSRPSRLTPMRTCYFWQVNVADFFIFSMYAFIVIAIALQAEDGISRRRKQVKRKP